MKQERSNASCYQVYQDTIYGFNFNSWERFVWEETRHRLRDLKPTQGVECSQSKDVGEDVRDDIAIRGAILTGADDKAFIAGADISELATNALP